VKQPEASLSGKQFRAENDSTRRASEAIKPKGFKQVFGEQSLDYHSRPANHCFPAAPQTASPLPDAKKKV
jgi:hypothetical protein